MPHLVGLMLIGAGLYAGYRALARVAGRMTDEMRRAEAEVRVRTVHEKHMGTLEYDPASGVYRPVDRR
ncbi:MAG: hypothetical protein ACKVP3_20075 [Hyphomicrobiaceae bacterium]